MYKRTKLITSSLAGTSRQMQRFPTSIFFIQNRHRLEPHPLSPLPTTISKQSSRYDIPHVHFAVNLNSIFIRPSRAVLEVSHNPLVTCACCNSLSFAFRLWRNPTNQILHL